MSTTTPLIWPDLIVTKQSPMRARIARAILQMAVSKVPVRVTLPDGTNWGVGGSAAPELVVMRPDDLFARIGTHPKIGLGEGFMVGDWTTGPDTDLADLLKPFAERLADLVPKPLQKLRRIVDRRLPRHERNTRSGSRSNIERHYDLSNELFAAFLDPTLTYSAAWFGSDDEGLHAAQLRKIDGILDQAAVGEGTRVLEIGSGWGTLAIQAAKRGATVTTITLSKEQAALARERFTQAGVADRIDLRIQDYREVPQSESGQYDAIVSVEMIEAVGEEFWPTYFATIDRLLAPGGSVSVQAITMADERYLATRNSYGWIQKYIFPGGLIPSPEAIDRTIAEHTSLRVTERRSLGQSYARTLRLWREAFMSDPEHIASLGFDETFSRMWEFYLAYCEAGFATRYLDAFQLQFRRP